MKSSGNPCMVPVEETAEERKDDREAQDEYMRSLRDKGLSCKDDDEAKQRPAASARSSSSVAKPGTTSKAAVPKLASLPARRPADPERFKREAAVSPERRSVRARKASPEGREPEALVPAAKEPSKFTDEGVKALSQHKHACNSFVNILTDCKAKTVMIPGSEEPRVTLKLSTVQALCDSVGRVRNSADQMVLIADGLRKQFEHERRVLEQSTSHLVQQILRASDDFVAP